MEFNFLSNGCHMKSKPNTRALSMLTKITFFWDNEVQSDPWMHSTADLDTYNEFQNIVQYCG